MDRHPNKEIRAAVDVMVEAGWLIEKRNGHAWGRAFCPGGVDGCKPPTSIWSTPAVPENHARQLRRAVRQCPHGDETKFDEGG
jgi:hypothetical protein